MTDEIDALPTVPENATLADRLEAWADNDLTADLSIGERTLAEDCREAALLLRPTPETWIPWLGGDCPVPADTLVDVKWNNGAVSRSAPAGLYARSAPDLWQRQSKGGLIVAYRLTQAGDTRTTKAD
jgi:hypothetical protein